MIGIQSVQKPLAAEWIRGSEQGWKSDTWWEWCCRTGLCEARPAGTAGSHSHTPKKGAAGSQGDKWIPPSYCQALDSLWFVHRWGASAARCGSWVWAVALAISQTRLNFGLGWKRSRQTKVWHWKCFWYFFFVCHSSVAAKRVAELVKHTQKSKDSIYGT